MLGVIQALVFQGLAVYTTTVYINPDIFQSAKGKVMTQNVCFNVYVFNFNY